MPTPQPSPHSRSQDWRSRHRRKSHAEAQSEPFEPVCLPDHPLISSESPQWITESRELDDLVAHVREAGLCCYDTEFIGESYYFPRLCLVQIATSQRVAVIDAMAGLDLTCVWELLADPAVLKVVHAGYQDLEPVVRHLGRPAANIFDTQIAAGFVGLPYPLSLLRLVQTLLGVKLGKALTFTSWDERPLSPAHMHYAADDVRFGPAIHEALCDKLKLAGTAGWAAEHCSEVCEIGRYTSSPVDTAQRIKGLAGLSRTQGAVLYELVALRDELARKHDVPPRSLIKDEVVVDIARRTPRSVDKLEEIRGLPRPVKADFGSRIVLAVEQGQAKGAPPWPKRRTQEETPAEQFRIDTLWAAVQAYCRALSVDPALLGSRGDLADVYRETQSGDAPEATAGKRGLLRQLLTRVTSGEMLRFQWTDQDFRAIPT